MAVSASYLAFVLEQLETLDGLAEQAHVRGRRMMGYYRVPVDVLEDASTLCRWAADSMAVAAAPRPARRRRTRK